MELNQASVVVLSAGRGSRVGTSKGLFSFQGRPWILTQLRSLQKLGLSQILVVLGHQSERYPPLPGATVVLNPDPDRGPFSSLAVGFSHVSGALFVLPVDVPCPARETWVGLAQALVAPVKAAVPKVGNRGGHPVLLSEDYVKTLKQADPQHSRLDHLLQAIPAGQFVSLEVCDPRAVTDLNLPGDWEAI